MRKKGLIIIAIIFFIILVGNVVFASSIESQIIEELQNETEKIDIDNITEEDLLKLYDDLVENYTTEDIVEIIEENRSELQKQGISKDIIDVGTEILKTTDTETVRDIIKNEIDVKDIQEKIEDGYTVKQIVKSIVKEIPTKNKVDIAKKMFFNNRIVKTVLIVIIVILLYDTIIRWIIYRKAGKHSWAAIIPIYRDIVMYKISDISPWVMLLWFIPIIGWGILFIFSIAQRVCLATNFGRSSLFAFGNIFFPIVFESIIAFNSNIQYDI